MVFCCGSALISDGYVNSAVRARLIFAWLSPADFTSETRRLTLDYGQAGTVNLFLGKLYPKQYKANHRESRRRTLARIRSS